MSEAIVGEGSVTKTQQWRERIAAQQRSGMSVRQFCSQQGLPEHAFYTWRKRLRSEGPLRFALVEPGAVARATGSTVELVLPTGERLCVAAGADAATIRAVLEALRA
jgi:hypothetical protein